MQFIKRLKPMVAPIQNSTANTFYVDTDDNTIKVGTGASGSSERTIYDSGYTGQLLLGNGTVGAPTYSFSAAPTTGLYYSGSVLTVSAGGVVSAQFIGSGIRLSTDANIVRNAADNIMFRNSTTAQRLDIANTFTSTTNFEAFSIDWQTTANVAMVGSRTAATGTARETRILSQDNSGADSYASVSVKANTLPFVRIEPRATAALATNSTSGNGTFVQIGGAATSGATSGSVVFASILPIYNQSASTAANTDFLVNRTQTSVGSGSQLLMDLQVGGTSQLSVNNTGSLVAAGVLVANSTSGYTGGGSTNMRVTIGSGGMGIYAGSGAPTISAPQGSIYLRSDGAINARLYIATDSSGTWTAFNTTS